MSSMLQKFTNPPNQPKGKEMMERINKDPCLKDILDEIETGGPAAMMRYWNDEEVLKNLSLAFSIDPNTGDAAASFDNHLGQDPPFSEVHKKLLFGFMFKLNLVDYAHSRPFGQQTKKLPVPFYQIGFSRSKSGIKLCVQETELMDWRKSLLPLLAELEMEEKVKVAKLVNVTEPEMLKVKVPRFTKEIVLVLYVRLIMADMRLDKILSLKRRRAYISDADYNRGGEAALEAAIRDKEKREDIDVYNMLRAQEGLKGFLKRDYEMVDKDSDEKNVRK